MFVRWMVSGGKQNERADMCWGLFCVLGCVYWYVADVEQDGVEWRSNGLRECAYVWWISQA